MLFSIIMDRSIINLKSKRPENFGHFFVCPSMPQRGQSHRNPQSQRGSGTSGDGFQIVPPRGKKSTVKKKQKSNTRNSYVSPSPAKPKETTQVEKKVTQKNTQNSLRATKLKSHITEEQLLLHFQQASPVDSVKIPTSKAGKPLGFAYINFSSHARGLYSFSVLLIVFLLIYNDS